jgi:glycosyltransferase involved in cell wall biosynthesis
MTLPHRAAHVVHLVTNDARMDSRVRRHAAAAAGVADRVTLVALEPPPGVDGVEVPGVETVRVGGAFARSRPYRAGRRLARVARGVGSTEHRTGQEPPGEPPPAEPAPPGLKTQLRDRLEVRHLAALSRGFSDALERLRPDVVVCNDLDTLDAGLRAAGRRGARVVFDAHELWPEHSSHRSRWWIERWSRIERALAPRASACITVNPSLADVLSARWGSRPVGVVRNALPLAFAPPLRAEGEIETDRALEIVYVGAYLEGRGLPELFDALGRLPRGRVRLTLYGYGAIETSLRRRALALGCDADVCFQPPLPQEMLIARVARADAGVVPYQPTNLNARLSTPTKLYEYLCAGLAIAASDLPAIRAIVGAEEAGVLFDPFDPASIARALDVLSSDRRLLARLRAGARAAFMRTYNWEHERDTYLAALVPASGASR